MGYYSIYKIIKDIIRTIFGRKYLKFLFIFIIIFIVITIKNNCFAISDITSIEANGITFNFSSGWNTDNPSYTGDMSNITILRYSITNSTQYRYIFLRTSYPISITRTNYGSYSTDVIKSLNNNTDSYFAYGTENISIHATSKNVSNPSRGTSTEISNQNVSFELDSLTVIYSNLDVYLNNFPIYENFISPSLSNTQSQLENLNFTNFIINANDFTQDMISNPDEPLVMLFYNRSLSNSSNTDGLYPIKEKYFYKESIYFDTNNSTDTNYIFNYPIFNTGVFFNIGSTYEIKFAKRVYIPEYNTYGYDYFDTNYIFTVSSNVTQDFINQLNQQTATSTDEDNQQDQLNAINNQTQAIENQTQSIDNINNSITDSTVDSTSINLPTDNTNDPTQSGVDNIFQTIYNSFTSGTAQDIVFPIPFTNKSITLPANYTYNSLNNNNASWIITIIQAFWWYLISRFIITDIMSKIRKIKQGNFDNIQNSNIKEDML